MSRRFPLQNVLAVLGLVLVIGSLVLTTVLPGVGNGSSQPVPATLPPDEQAVVFPTPAPGTPVVGTAGLYLHPTGTFTVLQPQGWTPTPTTQEGVASVSMVNGALYSVVHPYIQHYDVAQNVASLDAQTDAQALAASWSAYDAWQETAREVVDDRLVIDFELTLTGNTYLARHITWVEPDHPNWALVLRLVAPGNNPALLDRLQALVMPSFRLLPDALGVPLGWPAYIDRAWGYVIKYPETWALVDGGSGSTATLSGAEGLLTLTLSSEAEAQVADADAARAWVQRLRAEATILDVQPVARTFGSGYRVAYTFPDADGQEQSGLAVLLNGEGRLFSASVRLDQPGVNLADDGAEDDWAEARRALATFAPLPPEAVGAGAAG